MDNLILNNRKFGPMVGTQLPIRPTDVSFELSDVNVSIASAIRRVICDEIPTYILSPMGAYEKTIETNDVYCIYSFIMNDRNKLFPLRVIASLCSCLKPSMERRSPSVALRKYTSKRVPKRIRWKPSIPKFRNGSGRSSIRT